MNLPFVRFLQIRDRIIERVNAETRFMLKLEEVKLQITCQFISSTGFDGKSNKKNIQLASQIKLLGDTVEDEIVDRRERLKPGGFEETMDMFSNMSGGK